MPGELIEAGAIFAPLLARCRRIGLAVSGGPDSLALMLLARQHAAQTASHERFVVYSVDHGLRPEAAGEVAFVVATAERLGFAARALRWEGVKPQTGLQQAARGARYRLIAAAMAGDGVDVLVTAHHLGDQAETVLMRLAHGSGVEGLRGMDYFAVVEGVAIVRPLLGVDPADLAAIVVAAGLVPVQDPSNKDTDYERVRWRQMLPQLAALGLDARRLSRFAGRMREADEAISAMADQVEAAFDPETGTRVLELESLRALPRAVSVRVLAKLLREVGGGQKPHDLAPVESLNEKLRSLPALKRTTLHGCYVSCDGTNVVVMREPGRKAARTRPAQS